MKYIYLLFILIILYLLYCYYKKYGDQENFDPSLVPVSSIVTLAKVAQKLVNGGGTLTNPGNLQIGIPSAPGNLYITGTNKVDGVSILNGDTTINNSLHINGASSTPAGSGDMLSHFNHSDGNNYLRGNTKIDGTITSSGNLNARSGDMNTRVGGLWTGPGIYAEGSANLEVGAASGNVYIGASNNSPPNNLTVTGNSTVNGTLTVNNTTTLKNHISFIPPSSENNESYTLYTGGDKMTGGVVSNSLDMHTYQNGYQIKCQTELYHMFHT
jgi:hypothetical protein